MEKYLFESHKLVIHFQNNIKARYNYFVNTKIFWFLWLILIPIILFQYNLFFFRENRILFCIYFLATILLLGLLMPPIFYKTKGLDFFALKAKYFKKSKITIVENENDICQESGIEPFNSEVTERLFSLLYNDCKILDASIVLEKKDISDSVFSKDYMTESINNLRSRKHTDNCIYLTCDQKIAGFIIHEIFRPMLKMETKQLCQYFCYFKNNEFRQVNYSSINSTSKRKELQLIKPKIKELLEKSYVLQR